MKNRLSSACLLFILCFAPSVFSAFDQCPTVSLELVRELRDGSIIQKVLGKKVFVYGGKGLAEVHTQLPISSRKFEDTVKPTGYELYPDKSYTCTYWYDKTFGRTGELVLIIKPLQ